MLLPRVAFLFDVDGVLIRTHELQAEALERSFSTHMQKQCPAVKVPSESEFLRLIVGGTEKDSTEKIMSLVPELHQSMREVLSDAWALYFQLIVERKSTLAISDSIKLLRALHDVGHLVGLVSNSKLAEILKYCSLLDLNFFKLDPSLIVSVESGTLPKPSSEPYLRVAERFKVDPQHCVVFEDSIPGAQAGKSAGMTVVGLQSAYCTDQELLQAGATEVVTNLCHAEAVRNLAFSCSELAKPVGGSRLTSYSMQQLSSKMKDDLVSETYAVYCESLQGHTLESWTRKLCDVRDIVTRVGYITGVDDRCVGYYVFKIREVNYRGEKRLILLVSAGASTSSRTGALRGSLLIKHGIACEYRMALLRWPKTVVHSLDTFISYSGYRLGSSILTSVIPSPQEPHASEDLLQYMQFLAPSLGYKKVKGSDEYVWSTSSRPRKSKSRGSSDDAEDWFYSRVGDQAGNGLYCIAPVSYDTLAPMDMGPWHSSAAL